MLRSFAFGSLSTLLLIAFAASLLSYPVDVLNLGNVLFQANRRDQGKPVALSPAGELEAVELPLANTEGLLADAAERLLPPRWVFENLTEIRLMRFLRNCGITRYQVRVLLDKTCCTVKERGCEVTPPEFIIWQLSKENRQKVYTALARSPNNYAQRYAFRFPQGTLEERLHLSGLSKREVQIVSRLTYTNNLGLECFSDLQTVRDVMSTNAFNNLVGALYQNPAFNLRLRVAPESNVNQLAEYWGRGGREQLIEPLLKALRRVPGGGLINVSALLPPFARLRLFTYPNAWADPTAARQDCIFTSLNFFNEQPDTNFLDAAYVQKVVSSEYATVNGVDPAFGDLISLVDEKTDSVVHMCVYIADGFVFTKNGISRQQPWVLMRLTDVLKEYCGLYQTNKVAILRHKNLAKHSPV